jgi:hypothetical protein
MDRRHANCCSCSTYFDTKVDIGLCFGAKTAIHRFLFRTLKDRARKLSRDADTVSYIMTANKKAINLVWFAGSLPGHLLEILINERAPASVQRALPRTLFAKGSRWITYIHACVRLVQGLQQFDADHPDVSQALTDSGKEHGVKLLVDVLLFSFTVGMATSKRIESGAELNAVSDCEESHDPFPMRDWSDITSTDPSSELQGEGEKPTDDGESCATKFGTLSSPVDLIGVCVRSLAGFLQRETRGEKSNGNAATDNGTYASTAGFQSTVTSHQFVGRALVESIFDAMELFLSAIDDASGQRRKELMLYVAGTIEILYCCRFVVLGSRVIFRPQEPVQSPCSEQSAILTGATPGSYQTSFIEELAVSQHMADGKAFSMLCKVSRDRVREGD